MHQGRCVPLVGNTASCLQSFHTLANSHGVFVMFRGLPKYAIKLRLNRPMRTGRALAHRWHRYRIAGAVVAIAVISATVQSAEASYCGSYVISSPTGQAKQNGSGMDMAAHEGHGTGTDASRSGGRVPRVPTPCERGFCNGPSDVPATPPTVPVLRSFDQVLLQVTATTTLPGDSPSRLFAGSVQARSGFHSQLDRPPKPTHF